VCVCVCVYIHSIYVSPYLQLLLGVYMCGLSSGIAVVYMCGHTSGSCWRAGYLDTPVATNNIAVVAAAGAGSTYLILLTSSSVCAYLEEMVEVLSARIAMAGCCQELTLSLRQPVSRMSVCELACPSIFRLSTPYVCTR
jgi:hypothetical protein